MMAFTHTAARSLGRTDYRTATRSALGRFVVTDSGTNQAANDGSRHRAPCRFPADSNLICVSSTLGEILIVLLEIHPFGIDDGLMMMGATSECGCD